MGMMTEPASGIWREDLIENQVRNAHKNRVLEKAIPSANTMFIET